MVTTRRRFVQSVLHRLDVDGVYLTRHEAQALNQAIQKLRFVAPHPGPLSEVEALTAERFKSRAWEMDGR